MKPKYNNNQEIETKSQSPIGLRLSQNGEKHDPDRQAIQKIEEHFAAIMELLGLDLENESLRETPRRVARMYLKEIFRGLKPENRPRLSTFQNDYKYGQMIVEKNIAFYSTCEHHFLPIVGRAHVAYISTGAIIGLSKINRLVSYYAARPQVQERVTVEILNEMRSILKTEDVAVLIEAVHLCVTARGICDHNSSTLTAEYSGAFLKEKRQQEFLEYIRLPAATLF